MARSIGVAGRDVTNVRVREIWSDEAVPDLVE